MYISAIRIIMIQEKAFKSGFPIIMQDNGKR